MPRRSQRLRPEGKREDRSRFLRRGLQLRGRQGRRRGAGRLHQGVRGHQQALPERTEEIRRGRVHRHRHPLDRRRAGQRIARRTGRGAVHAPQRSNRLADAAAADRRPLRQRFGQQGAGAGRHDARQGQRSGLLHRSAVRSRDARDNHPDGHGRQARRLRPAQLLGRFGLQRPQKTGKIPDQVGQVPS